MKKIFFLILISSVASKTGVAQKVCCPQFDIYPEFMPCPDSMRQDNGNGGTVDLPPKDCDLTACRHTTQNYYVFPVKAGYTYTWLVTGGTAVSSTGNPGKITWGIGKEGKIKLIIKSADGQCTDTVEKNICLQDAPVAAFGFSPGSPVCMNQLIQFSNTSISAINTYWDFGDGTTSTQINPSHVYTAAGTYTITLAVNNGAVKNPKPNGYPADGIREMECGCRDTIRKTIIVKNESPLLIEPGCKKMLCQGDTAFYCTPNNCNNYSWNVTGGTILGGNNGKCITVVWNGSYPARVTLNGNCGGTCGNTASLDVPVLYASMPVTGSTVVCPGTMAAYSLPVMPGTFYNWLVSGGGTITGPNKNTPVINVLWGSTTGSFTITCNYFNPETKCSGTATKTVKILPPYIISKAAVFCVGDNFNFNANGSGTWSITPAGGFTPSVFAAGSAISGTWNKPGNYIITAVPSAPANFCSYPATLNITVNDTPKLGNITGDMVVCPNGTAMYKITSNINGGSFNWQATGGTITSWMGNHNDSVMIKWNSTGPYTVMVKQTVNGCSSSFKSAAINTYTPPKLSGITTTCMDNVLTYTAGGTAPAGGYYWSLSNGLGTLISPQGSNTMQVLWHGASGSNNNTCVLTVTTCAGSDTKTITVTAPPQLNIIKSGSLCSVSGISLSASIAGAGTYNWKYNGAGIAANTQSINITSAGIYSVSVTVNGCTSTAGFVVPEEKLNVTANLSTQDKTYWKCSETISTLLNAIPGTGGYCYQWYHSVSLTLPGLPVGANSAQYTAVTTGYYWCQVSVCGTSCKQNTDTIRIEKEVCGGGDGSCTPSKIDFSVSQCNPFNFTAAVAPAAALGTVHWYFGDGDDAWGTAVTHHYKAIGTYKVCAINHPSAGYCRADTCKDVKVNLAANFSPQPVCDKVTVTNLSQSVAPVTMYNWSFPGGSPATSNLATPPVITYTTGGLHIISLTISDGTCTSSYSKTVQTTALHAVMNIPSPLCAKTDAPFTAVSTGTGISYQWNFGDGFISNLKDAAHAYQAAGIYTVTLTVSNNGCSKVYTQSVTVLPEPVVTIGTDKLICPGSSTLLSAPAGYSTYQWYKNGTAIAGAVNAAYSCSAVGEYWVKVANGNGCIANSNHITVSYSSLPVADIVDEDKLHCTSDGHIDLQNSISQAGCTYSWTGTGPSGYTFTQANNYDPYISAVTSGEYQFILTVTNAAGCVAKDTICIFLSQSPTVTVTNPAGPLCEGSAHTYFAAAAPVLNSGNYFYQWTNGATGSQMTTGVAGMYSVYAVNPDGCSGFAYAASVKPRPYTDLFPVGCDTLCWTDTLKFPLPAPSPYAYNINWYDDDGTAIVNAGTGFTLPLANLHPGIHHLYATVSFPGGCADTTGKFDLYIKDCTLLPPCDNCTGLFESADVDIYSDINPKPGYQTNNQIITVTISKPVKEIRISLSESKYYWKDTTCTNCKLTVIERGCLSVLPGINSLGTLVLDNTAAASGCTEEIVFKNGTVLQPGTYTLPVQLTLPLSAKPNCRLVIDKLCYHLTLVDTLCRQCIKTICAVANGGAVDKCRCNAGNNWTNLNMIPAKPGIAKPRSQIFCGDILTGIKPNTPYILTGVYHCQGTACVSTKNEITVFNQVNQVVYTRQTAALHETVSFNSPGYHTVELSALCGTQKCICRFRVFIASDEEGGATPVPNPKEPPVKTKIDSVLNEILPPDFNGGILVAKNDTVLYEKYISYKDTVNEHTAFDIASVTKTFTSMAVLKLMEHGKISLDDAVTKYLPQFPVPDITIKMLLSHTSGLEDYLKFIDASDWDKSRFMTNKDLLNFIVANKSKVFIHTPGKTFDYSNTNFALLSLIIETVADTPYAAYMNSIFFKPLNMDDTYVLNLQHAATAKKSYYKNGKTYLLRYMDLINGDKCIYSTPQDLRKWDKGLRTMFKKETLDIAFGMQNTVPVNTSNYALGWKTIKTKTGLDVLYHTGWWAGCRSIFIRLPQTGVMIAAMSNNNHTSIAEIRRLCDLFGNYQLSNTAIANF